MKRVERKLSIRYLLVLCFGLAGSSAIASELDEPKKQLSMAELKKSFRQGEITDQDFWEGLTILDTDGLSQPERSRLAQMKATLLMEDGFPILAVMSAVDAISLGSNPVSPDLSRAWKVLQAVSERRSVSALFCSLRIRAT